MNPKMQPEIVSREVIKPSSSSSSPNNHKTFHNLSFFDQLSPPVYVPLIFFYTSKPKNSSHVLKVSLSAALSHYYPLAGRINIDNLSVQCNDDGVLFLEATMDTNLSQVLTNPHDEILKLFFPDSLCYKDSILTGPLAIQVTYFRCGGMSIGLCWCHKILDTASVCSFINKWASMATNKEEKEISPEFNVGTLYPPLDLPFLKQQQQFPQEINNCVSKRLVFSASKIDKLKAIVAAEVPNPTRVEVVTALLHKSAISAAAKASSSGSSRQNIMYHAINLRTKIFPRVSGRSVGNVVATFVVATEEGREVELGWLVKEFRQEKTRFLKSCCKKEEVYESVLENMNRIGKCLMDESKQVYGCSSWCRFQFYEVEFGWGKPIWVGRVGWGQKNGIGLMDSKEGDGIEAFVSLERNEFAVFENDQDLLSFCCINPSVLG